MSWTKWKIEYCNPNICGDTMKLLRETVTARNEEEAERKARKRLATTGMLFKVSPA